VKGPLAILGLLVLGTGLFFLLVRSAGDRGSPAASPLATPARAHPPSETADIQDLASADPRTASSRSSRETLATPSARTAAAPVARARLSGALVCDEGPVGGAQIVYQESAGGTSIEVTSGPRGGFTVVFSGEQEPGVLTIRARGYALLELGIGRLSPGENRALGNLHLTPGVVVEGLVRSASGAPVAGAIVSASGSRNVVRAPVRLLETKTDAAGVFRLTDAPEGKLRLEARAPRHGSRGLDVVAPATGVVLRLPPARELVVRVVDHQGRAVEGAQARLEPREDQAIAVLQLTDAKGLASFTDLGASGWSLFVSEHEYRPYSREEVLAKGELLVELVRWPCIVGRVAGPDGPAPPGTRVFARGRTHVSGRLPPSGEGVVPAADGSFELCPVFPGSCEVIAEAPGFARTRSRELRIPPEGDVTAPTILLTRGGTLELEIDAPGGRLRDAIVTILSQEPHAGAVWNPEEKSPFQLGRAVPDEQGHVLLEGLEVGATWVLVRVPSFLPLVAGPYGVTADRTLTPPPLHLESGGRLGGVVRDASGEPLADVLLLVRGSTVASVVRCRTDESGRFLSCALPAGSYRVWARAVRPGRAPLAGEATASVGVGITTELKIDL